MPAIPLLTRPGLKGPSEVGNPSGGPTGIITVVNLGASNQETNPGGTPVNPDIRTATDATSYSNTSWTPTQAPNSVIVIGIATSLASGGPPPTPKVTGNEVDWACWGQYFTTGVPFGVWFFAADASRAVAGATTIDFGATTVRQMDASFFQVFGVDLSDGVSAVAVQRSIAPTALGATTRTQFVKPLSSPYNRIFVVYTHATQEDCYPGTGFVTIDEFNGAGPARNFLTAWRPDEFNIAATNCVTVTSFTSSTNTMLAVELRALVVDTVNGGYAPAGPSWTNARAAFYGGPRTPVLGLPVRIGKQFIDTAAATGGNVTVNVDTPGAITWTGSAVAVNTTIATSAGAITWTGSTATLVTTIATSAGAITWTGSSVSLVTTIATGAGAITWTGSAVALKFTVAPTAGAITWNGSAVALRFTIAPTAGAIQWAGSSVPLVFTIPPTAGNITWQGSDVALNLPLTISVTTPGAITWTGSAVALVTTVPVTAGALQWAGQQLALKLFLTTSPGAITWTGQTITVNTSTAVNTITTGGGQVGGSRRQARTGRGLLTRPNLRPPKKRPNS